MASEAVTGVGAAVVGEVVGAASATGEGVVEDAEVDVVGSATVVVVDEVVS